MKTMQMVRDGVYKQAAWTHDKQDEKGVATMCKIMEDMRNEAAREAVRKTIKENARRLLKSGKIRINEVSDCFPDLLDSDVKELEAEVMQLA